MTSFGRHCSPLAPREEFITRSVMATLSLAVALPGLIMGHYGCFTRTKSSRNAARRDALFCSGDTLREASCARAKASATAQVDGRRPEYVFPGRPHQACWHAARFLEKLKDCREQR